MKFLKKIFPILFVGVYFLLFGLFITRNLEEISKTFGTTFSNLTFYFFLTALMVVFSIYFWLAGFVEVFKINKINRTVREQLKVTLSAMAANVIIPTAGVSAIVVYAEDAKRRGESRTAAVSSALITAICEYTSASFILILALIYLSAVNSLTSHVLIPALIFFFLTLLSYVVTYFSAKDSKKLERILKKIFRFVEKPIEYFSKNDFDINKATSKVFKQLSLVYKSVLEDPKDWFKALGFSLLAHAFRIAALYVIFLSLGVDPLVRVILSGYAIGELFVVVSPTPNGIGFVEGSMYLVFVSLGIPGPAASTATLIYRTLTFWVPLFIGFFIYQRKKIVDVFKEFKEDVS